ncbi:MAG: hypothetical protein Q4G63_12940 [Bacteroidia bacterium]|nr:hypothetical protein [Bacteroidia bacterium]
MKRKTNLFIMTALFFLMGGMACEKEEPYSPPSDPKQIILGKWEIIERGVGDVTEPYKSIRCVEYLADGRMAYYYYDTKEYIVSDGIYWIDGEFLYWGSQDKSLVYRYSYKFYEDKMWLQYITISATFDTFIYQRIK